MSIGEASRYRIMQLCEDVNLSVNILSSIRGLTQCTVNNFNSGRNHSTTVSTLQKLCDGLGITIQDFFQSDLFVGLEQEIK